MKEIKVIVLDFDGVLNNKPFRKALTKHPIDELRKPNANRLKIMLENVDPVNMERFKSLTDQVPEVKIVISSSWGGWFDLKTFKTFFKKFKIDADVIAITPRKMSSNKNEEIGFFFGDFEEDFPKLKISNYVIIDDDPLFPASSKGRGYTEERYGFGENFLLTKDETGLTDQDVKFVVEKLNSPTHLTTRVELYKEIQKKEQVIRDARWDLESVRRELAKPDPNLDTVKERLKDLVDELYKKS